MIGVLSVAHVAADLLLKPKLNKFHKSLVDVSLKLGKTYEKQLREFEDISELIPVLSEIFQRKYDTLKHAFVALNRANGDELTRIEFRAWLAEENINLKEGNWVKLMELAGAKNIDRDGTKMTWTQFSSIFVRTVPCVAHVCSVELSPSSHRSLPLPLTPSYVSRA